ncbi:MAG: hypothetical protein CSA72_03920 [Rhodobacterales bacterium]|nr:MAG: hypothetical protein CSA72_03920 [Rhodobacterales bacterium]
MSLSSVPTGMSLSLRACAANAANAADAPQPLPHLPQFVQPPLVFSSDVVANMGPSLTVAARAAKAPS